MADETTEQRRLPWWLADALWIAAVAAVFIAIVTAAWGRALEPITDTGRDLYIPERIRDGAKLYRDIAYNYPPLTPYLLAAITSVIGSTLTAYSFVGVAIAALTACALYAAGRIAGSAHTAGAATMLFASGSIYSMSGRTMNYLLPYAYATTLGILFLLTGAVCLLRYTVKRGSSGWLAGGVVALVAASWTRLEYAACSAALLVAAVVVYGIGVRWLAAYVASGGLSLCAVHLYFSDAPPGQHWLWNNVFSPALLRGEPARHFYRQVSGFDQPGRNLLPVLVGALMVVALAVLIRWADRESRRPVVLVLSAIVLVTAVWFGGQAFTRGWALLQFILIPFAFRRREPLMLLVVLSLCASSRVFLRLFPTWYGFAYVIPTYLLIAYVVFDWLPERGFYSRRLALLWIGPVAVLAAQFMFVERALLDRNVHAVHTARGIFHESNPYRAAVLNDFLDHLEQQRPRSLVVIPEGVALNYLARIPTPLSFHTFTPPETADPDIEQRIIREMRAHPPEMIAVVTRSVSDFGFRGFGLDYNRELASHIRREYEVERHWRLPGFELIALRHRAAR